MNTTLAISNFVDSDLFKCLKCGIEKNRSEFYKHSGRTRGIVEVCKVCDAVRRSEPEYVAHRSTHYKQSRRDNPAAWMHYRTKSRCKKLGIPFDLEISDIVVPEKCPVLGLSLCIGNGILCDNSPSLDRLNPKFGYIKHNVMVISNKANKIKNNASALELDSVVKYLEKNLNTQKLNYSRVQNRLPTTKQGVSL